MRLSSTDGIELVSTTWAAMAPRPCWPMPPGSTERYWAPMAAHLNDVIHAWAPDLRGHGDSFTPPDIRSAGSPSPTTCWPSSTAWGSTSRSASDTPRVAPRSCSPSNGVPAPSGRLWCFEPVVMPPFGGSEPRGENPLALGASRRRDVFESYDAAIANFSGKPPLDVFDPDALREYVTHGFARQPDGTVRLKCRPEG